MESTGNVGQVDGLHEALIVTLCSASIRPNDVNDTSIPMVRTIEYREKPCSEGFQVSCKSL